MRYKKKRVNLSEHFKNFVSFILRLIPNKNAGKMHSRVAESGMRKRAIRIKNKRRLILICSGFAATIVIIITIAVFSGNNVQIASTEPHLPKQTAAPQTSPIETVVSYSVVMPVYDSVSLSYGMRTSVIADVQTRLMELEYMDNDEADGIFGRITEESVNLFKNQHGLAANGVLDKDTYDLLFSKNAQYYTITIGAKNTDVTELQQRLYELDYISKADVDSSFGENTENAVKRFQEKNKLSVDGKVGRKTREMLYSEDAVANMFSFGDKSDEILNFQKRLKKLGYFDDEPNGTFGKKTKEAVKLFQEATGLIADGHIGPQTKMALNSKKAQSFAISIGAKGDRVSEIQTLLKKYGYIKSVDGYFGSATESAVRSFQKNNGLTVDGKVGKKTLEKLKSQSVKKYTGQTPSKPTKTGTNVESFISKAASKLGSKYVRGAKGPNSFDCSGFVYWCLNQVGVKQGYLTSAGWASSKKYTRINRIGDLKKGDILVVTGHVAIVAGNGYIIDASASNGKVVKRKYSGSWWSRNFKCGIRIF